jgi:succinyl-diaminopimelate desuccinylase
MTALDLGLDARALTAAVVDIRSESGDEAELAAAVVHALEGIAHLEVVRDGDTVLARTALGREHRVLLGGHIDTVPIADNVPARLDGERLYGCGTCDMKSSVAVMLRLAAALREPRHDLTYVFYECEEVEAERNGLKRIVETRRDWLDADLAILMEPTSGRIEAGCQGTLRADVTLRGRRAHSARSWLGENAIHAAAPVLARLADYEARKVVIDGCEYREGLSAVRIHGGNAGNVIPDECVVEVNFRFAPDRSEDDAAAHVLEVLAGFDATVTDSAPGALPGLTSPAAQEFVTAVGGEPLAKYGWTDVSRFSALGIPALNYGPGDPNVAHTRDEYVDLPLVDECERVMTAFLS